MKMYEETTRQETIFTGRVINLRVDEIIDCYGQPGKRELVEHSGGVGILALDEQDRVLMVRQYRYGVGEVLLEIPAGKLEPGEDPFECGKRELLEETGYFADTYTNLGVMYPTPAYVSERIYLYMAQGLHFQGQHFDKGEYLTCEKISLQEALRMVTEGEILDAKTQIAIFKAWTLSQRI